MYCLCYSILCVHESANNHLLNFRENFLSFEIYKHLKVNRAFKLFRFDGNNVLHIITLYLFFTLSNDKRKRRLCYDIFYTQTLALKNTREIRT